MSWARIYRFLSAVTVAGALAGCGAKKDGEEKGHAHGGEHDHAEGAVAVSFKAGRGLQLAPETAKAVGLTTADVQEREIAHRLSLNVTVLKAGPPAVASAIVTPETAEELERHPPREAKIVATNRALTAATSQIELTLELPKAAKEGAMIPLSLRAEAKKVSVVPAAAVLRSAGGTFLYVENGGAFLRTPVKVGTSDGEYTEIVEGVYAGDVVAATAVEQLWLTELRLTKGGGHSH
jgi:hypothetical protein